MKPNQVPGPRQEAHQTVRLQIDTKDAAPSIRISFTDQRLTAHGGLILWSHFLRQKRFRQQLREVLPHDPNSPNAYDPTDVALGYVGGILGGADKLSRVAWLQSDAAVAEVLGIEAVASQSTLSRFFGVFTQRTCQRLGGLHARALYSLPSARAGYTLDLDSWALLHEDGHQEGVAVGYTQRGLKPCHRPLIAGLAEAKLIANYWLRAGNTACVNGAAEFLRQTVQSLPAHIRIGLVRGDSGFGDASVQEACEALHHLAIAAYNLCVLLQRRLGQLEKCELNTLRWRLFGRVAVWSRTGGKPSLKLAVQGEANRHWWREILTKLTAPPNCHAVTSLQA